MKKFTLPKLEVKKPSPSSPPSGAAGEKEAAAKRPLFGMGKKTGENSPRPEKTEKKAKKIPTLKPLKDPKAVSKKGGGNEARYIFMLGDEGGILIFMRGRTVIKRLFAADTDPDNIQPFREVLAASPKAPVYALVDMMDQSYMKQTLPPVTKFSVNKLIKRRLERDFGPEDITGAFPIGRESTGRKDWNFMLVSLAGTPQLMQWVDFILSFPNPFEGLYLAPIEASAMILDLTKRHFGKDARPWQLMVCHHKVGGFRQVILKDGRLAFTRLAQAASNSSAEVIAGSIEQEVSNTIEYLKRLSYSEDQGIEVFMVLSAEIKRHIDHNKIKSTNTVILTPFEAAELLGLTGAALPEDHYADIVVSAYFGQLRKKILPLHNRISGQLAQFRQKGKFALMGAAACAVLFGGYTLYGLTSLVPQMEELDTIQSEIRGIQMATEEENQKIATLGTNLDRLEDIIGLHKSFPTSESEQVITFVKAFRQAAQEDVFVRRFDFSNKRKIEDVLNNIPGNLSFQLEVQFTDSTGSVNRFARKAKNFFERMKAAFPQYQFSNSKLPGIIDQAEAFKAEFTKDAKNNAKDMMSGDPIIVTLSFITPPPEQPVPY